MSHDRVFKEVKGTLQFVGDFEGLYHEEADPWGQSGKDQRMKAYYQFSRNRLMDLLDTFYHSRMKGLEVGCGLGYVTRRLNLHPGWSFTGLDISARAIEQASMADLRGSYRVGDITAKTFKAIRRYDCLILSQCWWYILHAMDQVVWNCRESLKPGGLLIISQSFLRVQRYGCDIADGIDGAMKLLAEYPWLRLVAMSYDDSKRYLHHDGLLAYRVMG